VLYIRLIIFLLIGDLFVDSKTFLVTDFMNIKIKSVKSYVFIGARKYMCIYIYTVFLKNLLATCFHYIAWIHEIYNLVKPPLYTRFARQK
jgi:hypothetical protein